MTEPQARNLGTLLRSGRERAGLSLRDVTALTGLPWSTIKRLRTVAMPSRLPPT